MPFNSTWPDGAVSVEDNGLPGRQNTTFIETTMQVDHYWDEGGTLDGHHKYVQAPKSENGGTPTDPTIATGMDGAYYLKEKTATEAPDLQNVLPYFKDDAGTPAVMELLGIRACVLFEGSGVNGAQTIKYSHNVASASRTAAGLYTITYTTALPTNNYLVYGFGAGNSGSAAFHFLIQGDSTLTNVKSTSLCKLVATTGAAVVDPTQAWIMCFGG